MVSLSEIVTPSFEKCTTPWPFIWINIVYIFYLASNVIITEHFHFCKKERVLEETVNENDHCTVEILNLCMVNTL